MTKAQIENYLAMQLEDLEITAYFNEVSDSDIDNINWLLAAWCECVGGEII